MVGLAMEFVCLLLCFVPDLYLCWVKAASGILIGSQGNLPNLLLLQHCTATHLSFPPSLSGLSSASLYWMTL